MRLIISPHAEKQFKKLSRVTQIILTKNIQSLTKPPLNRDQEKLKGYKNIYRIRVGDYRIVYKKTMKEIYIVLIGHRKDVYKMLERILK